MSIFPWESQWEMVAWFALFGGFAHYSDQLSAAMLQRGFLRQKTWWLRCGAACLAAGIYPLFYLGADVIVGEATRMAETPLSVMGRSMAAGVLAMGATMLVSTGRYLSLQREVLIEQVLAGWDFEFDDLVEDQVWTAHSIPDLNDLNSRFGRGRLSVAVLNREGEVLTIGVRRSSHLRFGPQEPYQLTAWIGLEGGQAAAIWFRTEEDRRSPSDEELDEVRRVFQSLQKRQIDLRFVLFYNGAQVQCLYAGPPSPSGHQGMMPVNRESTHTL
ncbi:hypothetical protein GTO89_12260 [Heliobacterium gestii]|uniref:Uncharacterized protein n=1 Tax=Heliomicrobium gestii TaxID=2699 RepID=A0A845LE26_HELGE|nr:hypothetical protein [Heliomicrobium gestii]MBM7867256.1 hypothetical protein [Heliomicrobium gestii]MZP43811.1 hypothetical protein [Heliomicrobium gestii]